MRLFSIRMFEYPLPLFEGVRGMRTEGLSLSRDISTPFTFMLFENSTSAFLKFSFFTAGWNLTAVTEREWHHDAGKMQDAKTA